MRDRPIHGTTLRLTELGFGAASLGNLYLETSDEAARAAVAAAWASGIRHFDTAPHYGLGLSERRLGAALAKYPRDEFVVSTKVGRLLVRNENPTARDTDIFAVPGDQRRVWDFSRDGVLRSIEQSLERLGLDRIDIVFLHDPDASGIPDAANSGAAALIELRDEGVVTAVGIGSNDAAAVADVLRDTDIDVAMLAGRHTLLEPTGAEHVFEAAGERSIIAAGVFNSGILSQPRPLPDARFNYAPASPALLERVNILADIAEAHGTTLPAAAIAFPLRDAQVASVTLGMRTAEEVRDNVSLLGAPLPSALWDELAAGAPRPQRAID